MIGEMEKVQICSRFYECSNLLMCRYNMNWSLINERLTKVFFATDFPHESS